VKQITQSTIILFLLFCPLSGLSAQNDQYLIPLNSSVYEIIDHLYLEAGMAQPNLTRPWTRAETRHLINQIDRATLSEHSLELFLSLKSELRNNSRALNSELEDTEELDSDEPLVNPDSETTEFEITVDLDMALETYLRVNNSVNWLFDYNDRAALINLSPHGSYGNSFYIGGAVGLTEEPLMTEKSGNWSNFDFQFTEYDFQFPFLAYTSIGEDWWNVSIGRSPMQMGPGQTGQLVISQEPHWLDHLKFSFWNDFFKYSGFFIHLSPWLLPGEDLILDSTIGNDNGIAEPGEYESSKYLRLTRLDFRIFPWLNFGLTEGLIWGGKYPDLRLLNPLSIFHNFYEWDFSSSLFSAELDITPFSGLNIYGQIAFNAITTAFEASQFSADSTPGAMAGMIGARLSLPIDELVFTASSEFVLTDPWLNVREHALISYHWRRKVLSNELGNTVITTPLGYKWGNDSLVFYIDAGVKQFDEFSINLGYTYVEDGVKSLSDEYNEGPEASALKTPSSSGSLKYSQYHIISLDASLLSLRFLTFSLSSDIIYLHRVNYVPGTTAWDFQTVLTIEFHLNRLLEEFE
jgi:hypothetical protein